MAMREFLDAECGQNPVLKVASHFTRDSFESGHSSRHASLLDPSRPALQPNTFRMGDLLKDLHAIGQNHQNGPVQASDVAELTAHPEWTREFLQRESLNQNPAMSEQRTWVRDYMSKDPDLGAVWGDFEHGHFHEPRPSFMPPLIPMVHDVHQPLVHAVGPVVSAREILDDSKWTSEYNDRVAESQHLEKTELMLTAEEFLKSVSDPKIKATEFMSFVEKLSTGEIGANGKTAEENSQRWVSEYEDEYVVENVDTPRGMTGENKEEFWQNLNDEWEKLAQNEAATHPWLTDPSPSKVTEPYQFSEENAFKDLENPFEEGKRKLLAGDIPSAVLLFESAVLKEPERAEFWMYLGTTQALNEQDLLSISALNKCLELEPNNLSALMSLATSLTNESFHLQACNALKRWLRHNDKYSHLVTEDLGDTLPHTTSLLYPEELADAQRLFMQAARINPSEGVDADVQCGLGILFSLGADFDKAADCFQAAVNVNPEDPLLWNRIGATLANGGKSSEAIGAYRRALELSPGYIRTRYNLGIACVNLGAYREAMQHFLTALNMQSPQVSTMSDSIWSSLRTSLHLSDMSHFTKFIDKRDLDGLNQAVKQ